MTGKREYGTGGISWLGPRKVRLRIHLDGVRKTRVVRLAHPKQQGGRSEATEALAIFRDELERPAPGTVRTLGEVVDAYIAHKGDTGSAQGTLDAYEHIAAKRLPTALKAMDVTEVTAEHLDALYSGLRKAKYASTSIRQTNVLLSGALRNAERWRWITESPAKHIEPLKASVGARPKLTPAEVWKLIVDAGKDDPVVAMALFMFVITGARRGELCGIRWDDIDPQRSCVHIARQLLPGKGGQYVADLKSETGADDGVRTVYAGTPVLDVIERYRDIQRALHGREPEGWLISHDGGTTPMRAKALGAAISNQATRSGFPGITTRSFRKVTANELLAAGVDVDAAARRMGHTTQVMLNTYVKGSDDKAIAAGPALEARLIDQGMPIAELFAT